MGGPYEPFGDKWIPLIVDLKAAIAHQPRPRPLDDPPPWENVELTGVDLVHHLHGDVVLAAMTGERNLETGVAP